MVTCVWAELQPPPCACSPSPCSGGRAHPACRGRTGSCIQLGAWLFSNRATSENTVCFLLKLSHFQRSKTSKTPAEFRVQRLSQFRLVSKLVLNQAPARETLNGGISTVIQDPTASLCTCGAVKAMLSPRENTFSETFLGAQHHQKG